MADFPATAVTGKLQNFFKKIQGMGVPSSVTLKWLPSIGFASNNDRPFVAITKFIGFVDHSGKPTARWRNYRDESQAKRVMAEGIKEGYSELFAFYPDAYSRSDSDLKNFFRSRSSGGDQVVSNIVGTFKALVSLADFSDGGQPAVSGPPQITNNGSSPAHIADPGQTPNTGSTQPSLHIDIQIHISPEATPEQIEKIFESMGKHLYQRS